MPFHGLGVMLLSCAACQAEGEGQSLLAAPWPPWRRTSPHWPGPLAAVCSSGMLGMFHQWEWRDLPLQHQQPTQNMQGNGLATRQGHAPSPVTDRPTDSSRSAAGLHCRCPHLSDAGLLPSPAVGACPCGAVPFLPCPGSMGGGDGPGPGTGVAGAPRALLSPALSRAGMPDSGLRRDNWAGQGAGLVSILPFFASSCSREKKICSDTRGVAKLCQAF